MDGAIRDQATCPICFDFFEDPRVLPTCSHTFCLKDVSGFKGSLTKECPICRVRVDVTNGIDKLPKNFGVAGMVDIVQKTPSSATSPISQSPTSKCPVHGEDLKIICLTCPSRPLICRACASESHPLPFHKTKSFSAFSEDIVNLCKIQLENSNLLATEFQRISDLHERQSSEISKISDALISEILARRDAAVQRLNSATANNRVVLSEWERKRQMWSEKILKIEQRNCCDFDDLRDAELITREIQEFFSGEPSNQFEEISVADCSLESWWKATGGVCSISSKFVKPSAQFASLQHVSSVGQILFPDEQTEEIPIDREDNPLTGTPNFIFSHPFKLACGISVSTSTASPFLSSRMVFVTDCHQNSVLCFDGDSGSFVRSFGSSHLRAPKGIDVSKDNRIFVADGENHRVCVFEVSEDGGEVLLKSFGVEGSDPCGQLWHPCGLAIDHEKREVHVCETWNHRVSVFSEDGAFLRCYGKQGSGEGELGHPMGVAVHGQSGLSFVVDCDHARVNVFKTSGEFVKCFGQGHLGQGGPAFISVDPRSGRFVFVANSAGKKVQIFNTESGERVGEFGGSELAIKAMRGIAVGHQGEVFVCCKGQDNQWKVMRF